MSHEERKELLVAAMGALHAAKIGQLNMIVEKGAKVVFNEAAPARTELRNEERTESLTRESIAKAVTAVQDAMWGSSAYAVLFCELRDHWDYENNMTQFEKYINSIAQEYNLSKICKEGTISDAFRHNPFLSKHVDHWKDIGVRDRATRLLDLFQNELP